MPIQESSEHLFHFTSKLEILLSILETQELWVSYSLEDYSWLKKDDYANFDENAIEDKEFKVAIPITCFCDIPETRIQKHKQEYGDYGISFSKEWGRKIGVNPLLCVFEKSNVYTYLKLLMSGKNRRLELTSLIGYCKPYLGEFRGKLNYNFYEEREWRYRPPMTMDKKLSEDDFKNLDSKKFHDNGIGFEFSDVESVIVREKSEVELFEENYSELRGKIRAL